MQALLKLIKIEFPEDGIQKLSGLEDADCDNCEKNPLYCEEQSCFSIMGYGYGKEKGVLYGLEGFSYFNFKIRKIIDWN